MYLVIAALLYKSCQCLSNNWTQPYAIKTLLWLCCTQNSYQIWLIHCWFKPCPYYLSHITAVTNFVFITRGSTIGLVLCNYIYLHQRILFLKKKVLFHIDSKTYEGRGLVLDCLDRENYVRRTQIEINFIEKKNQYNWNRSNFNTP